jgi:pyruvate/2-oxoglutarate/acetoin dehydrogenase E1 component
MLRDEAVMPMGEDVGVFNGAFKVTQGLLAEFGERRVRDTPISENTIVGMGVGAAMTGLRPVVESMTINFSLLALDQIVNHAAHIHYMFGGQVKVRLVVRMPQGAGHQLGLDLDTIIGSVRKTNRCVIVEEGWPHGGVGANLAALIQEHAFDELDAPIGRVAGADVPMPYSKPLEEIAFPHEPQVIAAALATLGEA